MILKERLATFSTMSQKFQRSVNSNVQGPAISTSTSPKMSESWLEENLTTSSTEPFLTGMVVRTPVARLRGGTGLGREATLVTIMSYVWKKELTVKSRWQAAHRSLPATRSGHCRGSWREGCGTRPPVRPAGTASGLPEGGRWICQGSEGRTGVIRNTPHNRTHLQTKIVGLHSRHIIISIHHGNEMDEISSLQKFEVVGSIHSEAHLTSCRESGQVSTETHTDRASYTDCL